MKNFFQPRVFAVSVLLAVLVTGITVWAAKTRRQSPPINIANKTRAFFVVSATETRVSPTSRRVKLEMQNGYEQGILVYSVKILNSSTKQGYFVHSNFSQFGQVVSPGEIITNEYGVHETQDTVRIQAVLFADGTTDGNEATAYSLKGNYVARREQARRALNIFRKAESKAGSDDGQLTEEIRQELLQLPEGIAEPVSPSADATAVQVRYYSSGLNSGTAGSKVALVSELTRMSEEFSPAKFKDSSEEHKLHAKKKHRILLDMLRARLETALTRTAKF